MYDLGVLSLVILYITDGGLMRSTEGEGHGPGSNTLDAVDGVEEDAGVLLGETAPEEGESGHGARKNLSRV